jgi:hypothetical protein
MLLTQLYAILYKSPNISLPIEGKAAYGCKASAKTNSSVISSR